MTESEAVRLIVVTFSPGRFLMDLLRSLPAATTRAVAVTVADNGSTDGTVEWVRARPELHLVETGANLGYGGAVNRAAQGATEDWLLVLNPDITFERGAIDDLLDVAGTWPRAGAIGPRIHTYDGLLYPSARELPSLVRGVGHALFGWFWPSNPWTASYRREYRAPVEGEVGWLSGSCLLVRREAFEAIGGFDERFFMYFEDTDLCERLGAAGWSVVYAPRSTVVHHGGHATTRYASSMSRAHHESAYRYLANRYQGPVWAPLRLVLWAGLWTRYQLSLRVGQIRNGARPAHR